MANAVPGRHARTGPAVHSSALVWNAVWTDAVATVGPARQVRSAPTSTSASRCGVAKRPIPVDAEDVNVKAACVPATPIVARWVGTICAWRSVQIAVDAASPLALRSAKANRAETTAAVGVVASVLKAKSASIFNVVHHRAMTRVAGPMVAGEPAEMVGVTWGHMFWRDLPVGL